MLEIIEVNLKIPNEQRFRSFSDKVIFSTHNPDVLNLVAVDGLQDHASSTLDQGLDQDLWEHLVQM